MNEDNLMRCKWAKGSHKMIEYHDNEWGRPVQDDIKHFEYILLDTFQAGLSWKTVLDKRDAYRELFEGFDPEKISLFDDRKINTLMQSPSIIRNSLKIKASVKNAKSFLKIQNDYGSFNNYIWQFSPSSITIYESEKDIPTQTNNSEKMSQDLKDKGFQFVGPVICYAYMQASGLVNDHIKSCFCFENNQ